MIGVGVSQALRSSAEGVPRARPNTGVGHTLSGRRVEAASELGIASSHLKQFGPPRWDLVWVAPNGKAHGHAGLTTEYLFGHHYIAGTASVLFWPGQHSKHSDAVRQGPFRQSRFALGAAATLRHNPSRTIALQATSMFLLPQSNGPPNSIASQDRWLVCGCKGNGDVSFGVTLEACRPGHLQIPFLGHCIELEASRLEANLTLATGWSLEGVTPANASFGVSYAVDI